MELFHLFSIDREEGRIITIGVLDDFLFWGGSG
jgi:hypothetical protein